MAELATIARPYAEALYKSVSGLDGVALQSLKAQTGALAALAGDAQLRQFADNPKVQVSQVLVLVTGLAASQGVTLDAKVANLLAP